VLRSDYPIALICHVLGLARSTAYYQAAPLDDQPLRQAITELAVQYPTYGTRRTARTLSGVRRIASRSIASGCDASCVNWACCVSAAHGGAAPLTASMALGDFPIWSRTAPRKRLTRSGSRTSQVVMQR